MTPFLEKIAKELLGKYENNISGVCVVFPSRRAGIFFKKYLSENIKKPIWLADVLAIQDFIIKFSPYKILDRLTLVFELYEVYKQYAQDESFDKFYPWGDMLLNDFEEIDKNLAEADYLFRILHEHKQIELDFDVNISDMEQFYKFWSSFSKRELSETQNEFIKTWEVMGKVYKNFRKALLEKSTAYEGMAYRRIYEMIRTNGLDLGYDKIIFAGFNHLTKTEEGIIRELINRGKAETYWDGDDYYMNNNIQEAGHFLRKSFKKLKIENPSWIEDNLAKSKKTIRAIGAPLQVSQAKVLGNELKKLKPSELNKTAVVLPDESMLIPVLHSIPTNIDSINVTMGFPLKNSSLYALIQILKNLQNNKKGKGASAAYYYTDVIQVLQHSYIKFLSAAEIYSLINDIKKRNRVYISRKHILSSFKHLPEIISVIFTDINTSNESLDYLYNIIRLISEYFESKSEGNVFENEYLFKVYTEINRLYDIINKYSAEMDFKTFWKILIEVLNVIKVPFTGEPLKGVQVMGLLETRLLDFENVFILSMNEGIMPKGNVHSSFIPYSLRKAFSLPTYEDEDSHSAYYLYRLLERAENVSMIYNTEPGKISSGEKSRFIMQIENELAAENSNIKFQSMLFQTEVGIPKRKEITVQKSEEIINSLKNEPYFSVTTLANYINCPLQFYFKTVAKLKEEETVDEFFTGAGFGTILHEIMSGLYNDYKGKTVDGKILNSLKNKLNNNFDELWEKACSGIKEFEEFKLELSGKNLLHKNIIKKLIEKILDNDIREAPFKIIEVEKEVTKEIDIGLNIGLNGKSFKVKLLGRLDRIEEKDGIFRIIDYKTGYIDKQKLRMKVGLENFALIFSDSNYKERFQQYLYSYLYANDDTDLKIKIGIYPLQFISEGIVFFEENSIEPGRMALFSSQLNELVNKIFDSTTPFKQTDDIDRCRFCPYKSICYRD